MLKPTAPIEEIEEWLPQNRTEYYLRNTRDLLIAYGGNVNTTVSGEMFSLRTDHLDSCPMCRNN